jgi:hypothetical protein
VLPAALRLLEVLLQRMAQQKQRLRQQQLQAPALRHQLLQLLAMGAAAAAVAAGWALLNAASPMQRLR